MFNVSWVHPFDEYDLYRMKIMQQACNALSACHILETNSIVTFHYCKTKKCACPFLDDIIHILTFSFSDKKIVKINIDFRLENFHTKNI